MDNFWVLLLDLAVFLLIMVLISFGVSKINYQIGEREVLIRIGSLTVRRISIADLEAVELGPREWVEAWTNTVSRKTIKEKGVTLFRRTGGLRKVVLTPDNPKKFVSRLKQHPHFQPEIRNLVSEEVIKETEMNSPNRFIERWSWNEEMYLLFLWIPMLISVVGGIILIPLIGVHGLFVLIGIPMGLLFWLMYRAVGRRVVNLKIKYATEKGELAECLSQIGYIEAPGVVIFNGSSFKIEQITGREALIPFSEITSVRVGRAMPGKYLFGKKAFVFRTRQYKRISFAVSESIGVKWSRRLAKQARKSE